MSGRDEAILAFVAEAKPELKDVEFKFSITHEQARGTLRKLRLLGKIEAVKCMKVTRWVLLECLAEETAKAKALREERRRIKHRKDYERFKVLKEKHSKERSIDVPKHTITKSWAPVRKRGPASVWDLADMA